MHQHSEDRRVHHLPLPLPVFLASSPGCSRPLGGSSIGCLCVGLGVLPALRLTAPIGAVAAITAAATAAGLATTTTASTRVLWLRDLGQHPRLPITVIHDPVQSLGILWVPEGIVPELVCLGTSDLPHQLTTGGVNLG